MSEELSFHEAADRLPALINTSLAEYVKRIAELYPKAEFYKEQMRDTGRGEGPSLLLTVCENGGIIEEDKFYYPNNSDIAVDLKTLDAYLNFD